ncbi:aquaporin-like protein [Pavlovales sp. CCMP2436]|nr:aquaporin-like protein [Pavlovales sp. CCMP2436]|mmetsp:Transcript_28505/g.65473  ORF Transcript_28505/g.65473 Transcript_28505/m.65473 type:complete len:388 (-) Transcript_28505:577-1740(-)
MCSSRRSVVRHAVLACALLGQLSLAAPLLQRRGVGQNLGQFLRRADPRASGDHHGKAQPRRAAAAVNPANVILRSEAAGECLGTFVLFTLGFGVECTMKSAGLTFSLGHIAAGSGVAVVLAVAVSSRLSDAHLNPAVTLAMVLFRGFSKRRAAVYAAAQLVGTTLASLLIAAAYLPQLKAAGGWMPFQLAYAAPAGAVVAAGTFAQSAISVGLAECLGTAMLVYFVLTVEESPLKPIMIGGAVAALISVLGPITGACLNPARDLGPRLAAAFMKATCAPALAGAGLGQLGAFVAGPLLGGALAGLLARWLEGLGGRAKAAALALASTRAEAAKVVTCAPLVDTDSLPEALTYGPDAQRGDEPLPAAGLPTVDLPTVDPVAVQGSDST